MTWTDDIETVRRSLPIGRTTPPQRGTPPWLTQALDEADAAHAALDRIVEALEDVPRVTDAERAEAQRVREGIE